MGIDTINSSMNSAAYRENGSTHRQNIVDMPAKEQQLSHAAVTGTSVTQTVSAVFKSGNQEQAGMEENSKHSQAIQSQLRAAISEANFKATRTRCEFSVDEVTNRISIKVIDKENDKVIREIPAEESLDMIAKIWELAGLLVDEKR